MTAILTWILHGTALTVLAALMMRTGVRTTAATRYCLWWAVTAAVLALPVAHVMSAPVPAPGASQANIALAPAPDSATSAPVRPLLAIPHQATAAAPWLAALLALVVGWRVLALARSAAYLRQVRARCAPLPDGFESQLPLWSAARDRGRAPLLRVTLDLPAPAVLGASLAGDRPIIALPLWTLETLEADSVDLIVLHELAHVERADDRDLLVQAAIEAVFGWHPAIWWAARRLDDERERACDDDVVVRTKRAAQYARCLVGVAAHAGGGPWLRTVPGVGRAGRHLAARVERLLSTPPVPESGAALRLPWLGSGVTMLMAAVLVLAAGAPRVHVLGANWDRMPASSMSALVDTVRAGTPLVRQPDVSSRTEPDGRVAGARAPEPPRRATRAAPTQAPGPLGSPDASAVVEPQLAVAEPAEGAVRPVSPRSIDSPTSAGGLLPSTSFVPASLQTPSAPTPLALAGPPISPWKRPADAGGYIGRGAAQTGESIGKSAALAGVKTAGFFSRMGRAVASSF